MDGTAGPGLDDIGRCFGGAIPAVLGTASADGVPNVTFLSRALRVDEERIALSNQFMSKTARNIAVNPRASLLLLDPLTHDEFRLSLVYERTDRRGPVFDRLRDDIEALAALEGMQDVYRLRAADIYRVLEIEQMEPNPAGRLPEELVEARASTPELLALGHFATCLARASDLEVLVETALELLDTRFGYGHTTFLVLDEEGQALFTIASRGFDTQGIGAEVAVGEGQIGMVAVRCRALRTGALIQSQKYSGAIRRGYEESGVRPGREVPLPGVRGVQSRIAVPAMALGQLVGVLVAESREPVAFGDADEQLLQVTAGILAGSVLAVGSSESEGAGRPPAERRAGQPQAPPAPETASGPAVEVRFFPVDGSVFVERDYLIKGVAGRILWKLLREHTEQGRTEFTNRELRLDPALELPEFRDNLESRLILLKRRLEEKEQPMIIEKTGRGRFRLVTTARFDLVTAGEPGVTAGEPGTPLASGT